jgi:hypothetical protein
VVVKAVLQVVVSHVLLGDFLPKVKKPVRVPEQISILLKEGLKGNR